MNRGEIRNLIRFYLNEPLAVFWSDAQLNTVINVAVPKVHNRIKSVSRYHFTSRVTFPTVANTEYYLLPTDCKDVKLVTYLDSSNKEIPLAFMPWPDPTAFTPDGLLDPAMGSGSPGPLAYWLVGRSIRLLPRPHAIQTIKLYYEARLSNLTDDADIPAFDADYHDMAAKWAAIESGVKNNNDLTELSKLYEVRDADMIQDVLHRVPAPANDTESYLGD